MNLDETILPRQFHDFYSEVVRLQQQAKTLLLSSAAPEEAGQNGAAWEAAAGTASIAPIHTKLLSILERQAAEAARQGGEYGAAIYREGQYVMAGLADEIFLNLDWEGQALWKANLLETKLFGTHMAGEVFFQRLDKLLKERDPAFTGLASVFLNGLALGFRGKYRDKDDQGQLEYYRRQLFSFIFHHAPDLFRSSKRLFPEAYAHTLDQGRSQKLPGIKRWVWLNIFLVILLLTVSHGVWTHLTEEVMSLAKKFIG